MIGAELYLGLTDHEFLTTAFHEWRNDPIKKWVVISIWAFTTKHLFFRDFLPKLDPYGLLADGITEIKLKMNSRRLNGN